MKSILITGLLGAALLAASACGPLQENNRVRDNAEGLFERVSSIGSNPAPAPADAPLTRAQIEAQPNNLLLVSLISRNATDVVQQVGVNGTKVTWVSVQGIGFVFDGGLLVGTRGLGDDLMGADVSGARQSLRTGGSHVRTLDFLNGLDQIVRADFQCVTVKTGIENIEVFEQSYATSIYEETCSSAGGEFKNTYWRDANGVIWQARQWVSPQVGYLGYQRL